MANEKPKVDIDAVRRELGVRVPYTRSWSDCLTMFALGVLVTWEVLFDLLGDDAARELFRSLGLLP